MKKLLFVLFIITMVLTSNAQTTDPLNSNYLINQGVSPRVLDFAANSTLQDGSLRENVSITVRSKGEEETYRLHSIYDPSYKYGLDIRFVVDQDKLSKKDVKQLSESIKNLHHFSRLAEHYLYDESTLSTVKNENGEVILEFYYRKVDVDPSMKHIKRLKGYVHFNNGVLDHVELVNTKPLKKGMDNYKRSVYFERPVDGSGYIVTNVIETYDIAAKGEIVNIEVKSVTKEIADFEGNILYSNESHMQVIENPDTLSVKLGGPLPLMGKPATKFGYRLPRPVGINALLHFQEEEMQFTGLSIGMNGGDMTSLSDIFLLEESTLRQSTATYKAKADVWILPFLNLMGLVGRADNSVDGDLLLTDEIKTLLGIMGVDAPDEININTDVSANLYGVGATLAGGISNFNFTLSGQYILAHTPAVNVTTNVMTATAMVGYMLPFGMNVMGGAQGQFYDPGLGGSVDLGDGNSLDFLVDFEPRRWNFIGGVYKGFAKHWELSVQVGVGPRSSLTTMLGYRF